MGHNRKIRESWRTIDTFPMEPPMGLPVIVWWADSPWMVRLTEGEWLTDEGENPFASDEYGPPSYWMPLTVPFDVLLKYIEAKLPAIKARHEANGTA